MGGCRPKYRATKKPGCKNQAFSQKLYQFKQSAFKSLGDFEKVAEVSDSKCNAVVAQQLVAIAATVATTAATATITVATATTAASATATVAATTAAASATAVATATAAVAATTATAAEATTTTAAAAATTATAAFAWFSFLHDDRATVDVGFVQIVDGLKGFIIIWHLDKCEAAAATSFFVKHHFGRIDRAKLLKQ
jgi:hypothetical protein